MSIGILELLILLAIVLVVFAGYFRKRLPEFGRSAGRGARAGTEKAREIAAQAGGKAGDKWDPSALGRSAGKGVREAREIRDSFKGALDEQPADRARPTAESDEATAAPDQPLAADEAAEDEPGRDSV